MRDPNPRACNGSGVRLAQRGPSRPGRRSKTRPEVRTFRALAIGPWASPRHLYMRSYFPKKSNSRPGTDQESRRRSPREKPPLEKPLFASDQGEALTATNQRTTIPQIHRGVAQPGRALRSGRRGRRFKSCRPDQTHMKAVRRACRTAFSLCAEHVWSLGGGSPPPNLMEVKGKRLARATSRDAV